jgi:hypothetical protein
MANLYFQLPVGLTDEMIWPDYPEANLAGLNAGLAAGLAAEPEAGGGPITRFLGYKLLGKPRATRAEATAMLPIGPGDPSPFFDPVDDISRDSQATLRRTYSSPLDLATCGPTDRPDWMTINRIVMLALAGGRAYWISEENALPVWFVVPDITAICPLGDGVETWETWGVIGESHKPVLIDGTYYRSSAQGASGAHVEIGTWVPLYLASQLNVISEDAYQAIQSANNPSPV